MSRLLAIVCLLACIACADPPAPLAPGLTNLQGTWRFATDPDDIGEERGWAAATFDDAAWREITVPGLWEPQGVTDPRPGKPPQPPTAQMRYTDYDGVAWYRRAVVVPSAWQGQALSLCLGRVDDTDRTYLNGTLVGQTGQDAEQPSTIWRRYALDPALVRFGEVNQIAVRVTDFGGPGGWPGPMVCLLPAGTEEVSMRLPSDDRPAAARFADPPGSARILRIHHGWAPDAEAARMELLLDLSRGFGGVATNVAWNGKYLEDPAAWRQLQELIAEAQECGCALWLYDEEGYPSGAAGGIVLRDHPEYESRGLFCADAVSRGEAVELTAPPGRMVLALAVPVTQAGLDPAAAVPLQAEPEQKLSFQPTAAGAWHILLVTEGPLYEGTHATANVFRDRRVPNLLSREATEYFLQVTHDRYAEHFGTDLGQTFTSTFTDEPSLMSLFLKPMPYRPLPWSANFARDFAARWGEELGPSIPLLFADGPDAERLRYRYWKLIAEQVSQHYFGAIREWCGAHGLRSGGHLLYEEPLLYHVPFYGDFMACARELTAPSIDVLTSKPEQVPPHIGRLVASAGELSGNTVTMSEASDFSQRYRPEGDTRPMVPVSEADIRGSLHRQQVAGVNTFTSYYSFEGLSDQELVRVNTEIGRVNTMIRGGHQIADVAVVYPVESVWPHYRPRQHQATDSAGALAINSAFVAAHSSLFETGRDYCFVDARALSESSVDGDSLVHGDLRWRVLVLPGVETLPQTAWDTIAAFARAGGAVVALGPRPRNTDQAFPAPEVQALDDELFGPDGRGIALPAGQEVLLPAVLDGLLERDLSWAPAGALKVTHRRIEEHDLYLVINDSPEPWQGTLSCCGEGAGELWDPATGASRPAGDGITAIPGYGAVLLRFASSRPRRRLAGGAAALPQTIALAFDKVDEGHGQFVEGAVAPTPGAGPATWTATARLARSDVDTHQFVQFHFARPADLSATRWLVIETTVPAGQTSGPPLLVIVAEAGGALYIAETGRSLGLPGTQRVYVPWERFHPLGSGAADANGRLDRDAVAAVSVGWGGHFGKEGDRIRFTAAPPAAAEGAR